MVINSDLGLSWPSKQCKQTEAVTKAAYPANGVIEASSALDIKIFQIVSLKERIWVHSFFVQAVW